MQKIFLRNRSISAIQIRVCHLGLSNPNTNKVNFSKNECLNVIKTYINGEPGHSIAKKFECSTNTIFNILHLYGKFKFLVEIISKEDKQKIQYRLDHRGKGRIVTKKIKN